MNRIVFFTAWITFACLIPFALCADESRTWRDSTGRFSIEAVLYQVEGDSVKLKKPDGKIVTLSLTQLSDADQRYVEDLAKENPFEQNQNPFEEGEVIENGSADQTDTDRSSRKALFTFGEQKVQTVTLSSIRDAGINKGAWACEPGPSQTQNVSVEGRRWSFHFPSFPSPHMMPRQTDFFVDLTGQKALTAFNVPAPMLNKETNKDFTLIFFADGDQTHSFNTPLKLRPLGFSPDGNRFLFLQESWEFAARGKTTLLHIADLTSNDSESNSSANATFEPFSSLKRSDDRFNFDVDIESALWVDNEHIFVQSKNGTLILLQVNTGKGVWQTKAARQSIISLSPNGKFCFIAVEDKTEYRETLTGKLIGAVLDSRGQKFRFSPNGQRFASCSAQGIILGDATTGQIDAPFFVEGSALGKECFWLDDRLLCLDGNVVDTMTKSSIWNYTGMINKVKFVAGYCWCFFEQHRRSASIVAVSIPHSAVTLPEDDTDTKLALEPGAKVSLILELSENNDEDEIRKRVEKKITDNGWILEESAPISIVLKDSQEKKDTAEYSTFRAAMMLFRQRGAKIEYEPVRFELSIMQGKTVVWNTFQVTRPPANIAVSNLSEKTVQEIVDKSMEEQTYLKWVENIMIPQRIAKPFAKKGTSRITESGIQ